jgi:hypothetical protein
MLRRLFGALAALCLLAGAPAFAQPQTINVGTTANDGTGDTVRAAFAKVNANFAAAFAGQVNVWSYLSDAEKADVAARTGLVDVHDAIAAAVAAVNATNGARLHFPAGRYVDATCNHTLTAPSVLVSGDGMGSTDIPATASGTTVECTNNTATLFTVNSLIGRFENINLKDGAASRSAGSGIHATNATNFFQKVDYENVGVDGFWDGVDVGVGQSWGMHAAYIQNAKHWGVRIRNTVNTDAGDWRISDSWFYPYQGAEAAIRIESSGGGHIDNVAMMPNASTIVNCISMDTTGNPSIEFTFTNNKCDHTSGPGINIVSGYARTIMTGNMIKTDSLTDPAVHLGPQSYGLFADNVLWGNGEYAVTTETVNNTTFGCNQTNGFTKYLPPQDSTSTIMCVSGIMFTSGAGAPSHAATNGSFYLRTDGTSTTTLYVRAAGAWVAR